MYRSKMNKNRIYFVLIQWFKLESSFPLKSYLWAVKENGLFITKEGEELTIACKVPT